MAKMIVRHLEEETVRRLKERARRRGHSLTRELRAILAVLRAVLSVDHAVADSMAGRLAITIVDRDSDRTSSQPDKARLVGLTMVDRSERQLPRAEVS